MNLGTIPHRIPGASVARVLLPGLRALAPGAALLAVALLGLAPPAPALAAGTCAPNNYTCSYAYTNSEQTYAVPPGVTAVQVVAVGAPGASTSGGAGGNGAVVHATVPVPAGTTTLYVEVGGPGDSTPDAVGNVFNGGGLGAEAGAAITTGGGASDVRTCSMSNCPIFAPNPQDPNCFGLCVADSRLVVAGGGGGAGSQFCPAGAAPGGPAGDPNATGAGASGGTCAPGAAAGFGGSAGGAGRYPGAAFNGLGGTACVYDMILNGRIVAEPSGVNVLTCQASGGGGGGGYYGGGAALPMAANHPGGGGGAGSSFWVAGATATAMEPDFTGVPSVTITAVDTVPPTISASATKADGTPYTAGSWSNQTVTVHFTCSDALSGVASCPADQVFSADGVTAQASGTATDIAGNQASASFGPIQVDKTPPTISAAATTQPNANGWYDANVTAHFTCVDNLSGVASCPPDQVLSQEGSAVSSTAATATDNAGNVSAPSDVVTVKIDKTPPTIAASATKADGTPYTAGTWTDQTVTVHFTCADALSGVASCPADQSVGANGVTPSVSGTATDQAGNTASASFGPIQVDKTPPTISATAAPGTLPPGLPLLTVTGTATVKNGAGATLGTLPFTCFDTRGLAVVLTAADPGGSGAASMTYAATGAQTIASTTVGGATDSVTLTTPGQTTLTYAATDLAGNQAAPQAETVVVGVGFACAGPQASFSVPAHGTLVLTGTATVNGESYPFSRTIPF